MTEICGTWTTLSIAYLKNMTWIIKNYGLKKSNPINFGLKKSGPNKGCPNNSGLKKSGPKKEALKIPVWDSWVLKSQVWKNLVQIFGFTVGSKKSRIRKILVWKCRVQKEKPENFRSEKVKPKKVESEKCWSEKVRSEERRSENCNLKN